MTRPVDVSVLMPVLNEERHISEALAGALGQRGDLTFEILVADGGSTDQTRDMVRLLASSDSRVILLDNPHRTTPAGLNVALRQARGRFVARMDAHSHYPPDYLLRGVTRLAKGDVASVSGPPVPSGTGRWSGAVTLALGSRLGVGPGGVFTSHVAESVVDSGFTGLWRRDTVLRHGGWDEGWPVNQDAELAARIRKHGGRIVCVPEMAARYVPRDSLPALARQYWRWGHYRAKTCRRHPESMRRTHLLAPTLVCLLGAALTPRRGIRRAPRAIAAAYGLSLLVTAALLGCRSRVGRALRVPVVLSTMHLSWGAGFLAGSARFGVPWSGMRRSLLRRRATDGGDPQPATDVTPASR